MIEFRITLTGAAPLLMHSSRLANPLDPTVKAIKKINSKRTNKTEEDHADVARLEWFGSLYLDADVGPYIPGENLTRALVEGAKVTRRGKKVTRGLFITTDINPLQYRGPRDAESLWADENFRHTASVKVTTNRIMRTRPVFRDWSTSADGILDPQVLDLEELSDIADAAGQMEGLGDWRPRFGRFTATVEAIK